MVYTSHGGSFIIKIPHYELDTLYDYHDEKYWKTLVKRIMGNDFLCYDKERVIFLNIYVNEYYGVIIEVSKDENNKNSVSKRVQIIIHFNSIFFYEIDYFDATKLFKNIDYDMYIYKGRCFAQIKSKIDDEVFYKITEYCDIIYKKRNYLIPLKGIMLQKRG